MGKERFEQYPDGTFSDRIKKEKGPFYPRTPDHCRLTEEYYRAFEEAGIPIEIVEIGV